MVQWNSRLTWIWRIYCWGCSRSRSAAGVSCESSARCWSSLRPMAAPRKPGHSRSDSDWSRRSAIATESQVKIRWQRTRRRAGTSWRHLEEWQDSVKGASLSTDRQANLDRQWSLTWFCKERERWENALRRCQCVSLVEAFVDDIRQWIVMVKEVLEVTHAGLLVLANAHRKSL